MHSFEVHSNERVCRKSGRLGLEQVIRVGLIGIQNILSYCHTVPFGVNLEIVFNSLFNFIFSNSNLDSITYVSHYERKNIVPGSRYRYNGCKPNDNYNGFIDMIEYHVKIISQFQYILEKVVRS